MLYRKKSFSLPATNQSGDCSHGHAMLDKRGKCIRCGERIEMPSQALRDHAAVIGGTVVSMSKTIQVSPEVAEAITANPGAFKAVAKQRLDEAMRSLNDKFNETYG